MRAKDQVQRFTAPRLGALGVIFALSQAGCGDDEQEPPSPAPKTKPAPMPGWKVAVGDGGILLETFDDATWEARKVSDRDLYAVSCIDNEIGWAVGAQGFIGHTRDAGWSWPAQASGVESTLRAVSFAFAADASEVGLAAGDDGVLLTTRDGGQSWQAAAPGSRATLRGTAISEDAELLVAVGDGGTVLRSDDGGVSFEALRIAEAGALYDVALDAAGRTALTVDDAGRIYRSLDGARSFERWHSVSGSLESVSLGRSGKLASIAGPAGAWLVRDGALEALQLGASQWHATLVGPREDRAYFAGDSGELWELSLDALALTKTPSATTASLRGIEDLQAR